MENININAVGKLFLLPHRKGNKNMENIIKIGTVIAHRKSPNIHNEIVKIYDENSKKMIDVEQYGATLSNKEHDKKVTFFYDEIVTAIKKQLVYIISNRK